MGQVTDVLRSMLVAVRVRLRLLRLFEVGARWTLYASCVACVFLVVCKFAPIEPQITLAVLAIPAIVAVGAAARRISWRECAWRIDEAYGLEERVATAAEVGTQTAMACALRADAERALSGVMARRVVPMQWPRQTRFLALSLGIILALAWAPSPKAVAPALSPAIHAAVRREGDRLRQAANDERFAAHARELERILEELESRDPRRLREALRALAALEAAAEREADAAGVAPETAMAMRELAELASGAGAGLEREMRASGIEVVALATEAAEYRLDRTAEAAARSSRPTLWDAAKLAAVPALSFNARASVEEALRRRAWDPRYDEIVKRYYEERP